MADSDLRGQFTDAVPPVPEQYSAIYLETELNEIKRDLSSLAISTADFGINVKDYGARGNGTTDDSGAIQDAIDAAIAAEGGTLFFPPGTYLAEVTISSNPRFLNFVGESAAGSILKSSTADTAALTFTATSMSYPIRIQSLKFDGSTRTGNGIYYGTGNISSGLYIVNCAFYQCNIGVYIQEAIDTSVIACLFWQNNFDTWLEGGDSSHGSCVRWHDNRSLYHQLASIVIDGAGGSDDPSQIAIRDSVIEQGQGFAVHVRDMQAFRPLIIDSLWAENNGQAASVTIDGVAYNSQKNFYFDECGVVFRNCEMRGMELGDDVRVRTYNCGLYESVWSVTKNEAASSDVVHIEPVLFCTNYVACPELCIGSTTIKDGRAAWLAPITETLSHRVSNLLNNGSCHTEFSRINDNGNTVSWDYDQAPPIHGAGCMAINFAATGQNYNAGVDVWSDVSTTTGKWYVASIDAKAASAMECDLMFVGTGYAARINDMILTDEWQRFYSLIDAQYTAAITGMWIYNGGATDVDTYWANAQLVEFDTLGDAHAYILSGAVATDDTQPSRTVTAAGPTDDLDVAGVKVVFVNTSGNNVTIGGFTGGVSGQEIQVVVVDATNNTILEHAEGTGNQDIYLNSGGDQTLAALYGGWTLICNGTHWYEVEN